MWQGCSGGQWRYSGLRLVSHSCCKGLGTMPARGGVRGLLTRKYIPHLFACVHSAELVEPTYLYAGGGKCHAGGDVHSAELVEPTYLIMGSWYAGGVMVMQEGSCSWSSLHT